MGQLRASAVTAVHVVVPDGIDDPARPSGGNAYDAKVCRALAAVVVLPAKKDSRPTRVTG